MVGDGDANHDEAQGWSDVLRVQKAELGGSFGIGNVGAAERRGGAVIVVAEERVQGVVEGDGFVPSGSRYETALARSFGNFGLKLIRCAPVFRRFPGAEGEVGLAVRGLQSARDVALDNYFARTSATASSYSASAAPANAASAIAVSAASTSAGTPVTASSASIRERAIASSSTCGARPRTRGLAVATSCNTVAGAGASSTDHSTTVSRASVISGTAGDALAKLTASIASRAPGASGGVVCDSGVT